MSHAVARRLAAPRIVRRAYQAFDTADMNALTMAFDDVAAPAVE